MATDSDLLKDYNEAYQQAYGYWNPYISEATEDIRCSLGDQWDSRERTYLKRQRREALVFNKVRRIVKLISGYQRKNRLSLKADPVENSDTLTASQLTALMMHAMQYDNIYNKMSDAFEQGSLKSGLNLVELFIDYSDDPVSGDIRAKRIPHNRFLLDPLFSERDLTDNGYAMMRDYLRRDQLLAILPAGKRRFIKDIKSPSPRDNKYVDTLPTVGNLGDGFYRYDRFYQRTFENTITLHDRETGRQIPWEGTKERLREVLGMFPSLVKVEGSRVTTNLTIFVEDQVIYNGPDPTGLKDYPFVPVFGFWEPEFQDASLKLQGVVRSVRDPQTEINKRRSKMLDIIDSQITTGWRAKAESVVNPEALYQSGQGQVIWMKKNAELTDAQQLNSVPVPEGIFRAIELMDRDAMDISAVNLEMFGQSEGDGSDVSGILSKMRTGAGLTALQDLFDNYRLSKKLLGAKLIKLIQMNYTPGKVQRITGQAPSPEFYNQNFGKYDSVPEEGALTDTQKQMAFMELIALREKGIQVSDSAIIRASSIQGKEDLAKDAEAAAQAQQDQAKQQQQLTQIQLALITSEIEKNRASTADKRAETISGLSKSRLDKIKAIAELSNIPNDQLLTLLERLKALSEPQRQIEATLQ